MRQSSIVRFLIIVCTILSVALALGLVKTGSDVYASDSADLYDAIPVYADGTEGKAVHSIRITNDADNPSLQRTVELVQLPEETVRVKFYGGSSSAYWQPVDGNGSKGDIVFKRDEYSENGWWTVDVSELSFKVKTSWYNNTLLQDKAYYVKEADYYELTNKTGNINTIVHFFIQIGNANSPLDVLACNKKDYPIEWSKQSFRADNYLDLNLGLGKRNNLFNDSAQEIYYTIDGTDPVTSDTAIKYSDIKPTSDDPDDPDAESSRKVNVTQTCILKAASKRSDGRWGRIRQFKCTVNAPKPFFSPAGGWYAGTQYISINSDVDDAEIYYTTDGSDPVDQDGNLIEGESIRQYSEPIIVENDQTINAVVKKGHLISMIANAEYVLSTGIDIDFNGNDQGVWLFEDTIHTSLFGMNVREGTIVTPYGHSKCSVIVSTAEGAALKLNGIEMPRETTGENAGKYILDLDVRENAKENDSGAENVITVENGNKSATYKVYCIASIYDDIPDKVTDYFIPASQYTNNGYYGCAPNRTLIGKPQFSNASSLGNYGGYITWYYEDGISNDHDNPYGVDFIVIGNSFDGTNEAAEPGNIMVSEDGDKWYTLAGSIHYDDNAIWNYPVTYSNKNGFAHYVFPDREGTSRFYFPKPYFYPLHSEENDYTSFITTGTFLIPVNGVNEYGNVRPPYPAFGYADVCGSEHCSNEAENPYSGLYADVDYGDRFTTKRNGDACDISWAVDENGYPVHLDTIHYIKVQTATFIDNGAIGEKSTEVNVMRKAKKSDDPVGITSAPASIKIDGKTAVLKPDEVTNVEVEGIFDVIVDAPSDTNVYINSLRSHTAFMNKAPHDIVRIIIQEGEKEPLIYYFKIDQSTQPISRKVSEITFKTRIGLTSNLKGLLHDKDLLTNYYDADTIDHIGGELTFDEPDPAKGTQTFVWWQDDGENVYRGFDYAMAQAGSEIVLNAAFYKTIDVEAANAVNGSIEALPDTDKLTLEDAEAVKAAQDAYDGLTDDQKKLISSENKFKIALASATISKLEAEARADAAESAASDLQTQLTAAQNALTAANNRVSELEGTVNGLQKDLSDAQAAVTEAQNKYNQLKTESDADKAELAQAKEDLETARAAEAEAKSSLKKAQDDLTAAKAAQTEAEDALKKAKEDLVAAAAKVEEAQGDAEKQAAEIAELKEKNAILNKTIKKFKAKAKKKSALVSWKKVGSGFTYEVYRSTDPTKTFKKVATVKKVKTTVKKLKKGKTYYFKVRAFKKVGGKKVYTGYSNIAKVKIKK